MTAALSHYDTTLGIIRAVAAIRDLGEVPSGHLYARLMDKLTIEQYTSVIEVLKSTGLVKERSSHLLVWTGPRL